MVQIGPISLHATRALFGMCSRKYIPHASPLWQAACGSSNYRDSISRLGGVARCDATGLEEMARELLLSCRDVGRLVAESSLSTCLEPMRLEYTKKCGCGNTVIERIFSLMAVR